MKDTVRLGRIAGVPVGINWSLAVIVVVFAGGLAENRFPADAPGYGHLAYLWVGALTAVALLAAVLLHELGHAFVARRSGMDVEGITLSWMGGVTRIAGDSPSPIRELGMAGIGPLISFAVGFALWGVRALAVGAHLGSLAITALGWLAVINVVLAIFNLIPAAPLDGGRILHAGIWWVTRDRWRAARATSAAGVLLAAAIILFGLWQIVDRRDSLDGLLVAVLGWWILSSARMEDRQAVVQRALDGLAVHQVMRPVAAAPGWLPVEELATRYASTRTPATVWMLERWGGGYSGVVSGEALLAIPPPWNALRTDGVAVPVDAASAAGPWEPLLAILERTQGRQVVLVVDGDRTVGAVLPVDLDALVRSGGRQSTGPTVQPGTR